MNDPYASRGEHQLADDTVEMPAVDDDGDEIQGELALWPDGPGDLQA